MSRPDSAIPSVAMLLMMAMLAAVAAQTPPVAVASPPPPAGSVCGGCQKYLAPPIDQALTGLPALYCCNGTGATLVLVSSTSSGTTIYTTAACLTKLLPPTPATGAFAGPFTDGACSIPYLGTTIKAAGGMPAPSALRAIVVAALGVVMMMCML